MTVNVIQLQNLFSRSHANIKNYLNKWDLFTTPSDQIKNNSIFLGYRGNVDTSESGKQCLKWEDVPKLVQTESLKKYSPKNFAELSGGHRFCRNPINQKKYPEALLDSPWCFVQSGSTIISEACEIQQVKIKGFIDQVL